MLKVKHGPNFMIFKLQERGYDYQKFDDQVYSIISFQFVEFNL